jgi:hypothetical protein
MKTVCEEVLIRRVWAMPSKDTFTILPIKELLDKYSVGDGWIDPFAGDNSPAENTNDLNPYKKASCSMDAGKFCELSEGPFTGVLFDPPYSPRQVKECYNSFGLSADKKDTQLFGRVKRIIAPKILLGGYAICFGWNSNGFGKKLGFEQVEILMVAHGANHNDTIVTVEQKIAHV